jgi:hypothetical protein
MKRIQGISKKSIGAVHRTIRYSRVTLGDLITAAYDVGGSTEAVATLLRSPNSPLHHLIGHKIVIASA